MLRRTLHRYLAWDIIDNFASAFVACSDEYAARGMCLLGKPLPGDAQVISGESGAVTAGVLDAIMQDAELAPLKEALGLNASSRVLLISTEGDTDKENCCHPFFQSVHSVAAV